MKFNTESDAYDFYNKYGNTVEFSIRRSKWHKDDYGYWKDGAFCCFCQGTRLKDKHDDNVKYHRLETRFGCLAVLKVSRFNGKFQVSEFIADHTHALASPSKRMFLRSHRRINLAQAAKLEIADRSGLAPKESVEFLARKVGGIENLDFIPEDYSNYLRTRRT
ncbi:FAR1-related sequence 5 [Hibiscus trionum]|uniref:FAR1-related sequence 5 n=1 Tax=Hibiscus trionum TaxID=183268 RepID=A0A9W7HXI1_HIBTR|nr:FAR1-related sequence 5 [Hibiscus trionum]